LSKRFVLGIPARMGSTRFPGKPLCDILGFSMIEHVYRRCCLAHENGEVFVATCDEIIKEKVESFGGKAIMTPASIERPALRVAEACRSLGLRDDDLIAVVQGDEPLIHPYDIRKGIDELINNDNIFCANLCSTMKKEEWLDKDEVKVVFNLQGHAIYLSRSPIPSNTKISGAQIIKQLGVFFFSYRNLISFQSLSRTPSLKSREISY
jgi:3-deoxy-manno-octulosonate cytidylyltransferase (CMP-KDO synthetase)